MARPWQIIESVDSPEGILELRQREEKDFLITIAGRVLMNSMANRSEIVLSELACRALGNTKKPRVLIGGLGMGCTLKAALDALPKSAEVIVAELNPVVIKWCQGPLAPLTDGAVKDDRVNVEVADVASLILNAAMGGGERHFDAIILDLYEGPFEAGKVKGEAFYGDGALELTRAALKPGGVFAVWSEDPDKAFEKRLKNAGFSFDLQRPGRGGLRHVVYVAKRSGLAKGAASPEHAYHRRGRKKKKE